ncbi:type II toxin-antitoxin system HipA family toxin [Myxococcota bacterium]|nr:type II toxin-antitoxin system HipA family toxin [Myxococcota bacterium]
MSARVYVGSTLVGHPKPSGALVAFEVDPAYAARDDRPVLGRWFEERDLSARRTFVGTDGLPSFFRNALPEGALRALVERPLRGETQLEYKLLLRLGGDLPGALRVEAGPPDEADDDDAQPVAAPRSHPPGDRLRYSIAGVQLKASLLVGEDKVTLPLVGSGGDWLGKFPSDVYKQLPENEHALLVWARASGLDVPEHRLVDVASIDGLPPDFPTSGRALLVRRFDRSAGGRVHQEDFAQVFGLEPWDKFRAEVPDHVHHASIGLAIRALCGEGDFLEYLRRFAFVVLSGNGDAHVKNWSVVYPAGADPEEVEAEVRAFVARARDAWGSARSEAPTFVRDAIDHHLTKLPLT